MSLYCEHKRIRQTCEDCAWQRVADDAALRHPDPAPEVTRGANHARAAEATRAVERAAQLDDAVSLDYALDPPKRRR